MDEKGVSPVIGVILMVAATIVIAAVVMGMLGGFGPPRKVYSISVTAEERNPPGGSPTIYITYHGGPDAGSVVSFNITVNGVAPPQTLNTTVGSSVSITGAHPGAGNDHVIVTAKFADGSEQTVLDTWV